MGYYARGEVWIPGEEFWEFVFKHLPHGGAEVSFGTPVMRDGELVIPYALNTECHPKDEADPPAWLKPNHPCG
jgi:hypothetical protein